MKIKHLFYRGGSLDVLRRLPAESVHCCVTSPPYWALRDYGVEGQIGLEETPDMYVSRLVDVFREVRRVLRDDGTLWLNLGDSYAGSGKGAANYPGDYPKQNSNKGALSVKGTAGFVPPGLKPKDLCGIPWRVAFALQADGWYLRSEITWCKAAPMPESVNDRPTSATEKVFLLTKQPRYFYDAESVRVSSGGSHRGSQFTDGKTAATKPNIGQGERQERAGRNLWNYWVIPPHNFPEAHFATFPPALIIPLIRAGTSEKGCCPKCGAPWERMVETGSIPPEAYKDREKMQPGNTSKTSALKIPGNRRHLIPPITTTGFQPTCTCPDNDGSGACVVLDPFGGSGTVSCTAKRLGRGSIYIDLNPDYLQMALKRMGNQETLFEEHGIEVIQ